MLKDKNAVAERSFKSLNDYNNFQIIESYKTIRTNLLFTLSTKKSKTVIISSSEPKAGKSTTCSNLAITMAQTNARVLLIDCDLRKPSQHKILKLNNLNGLSKLLSGLNEADSAIQKDVMPGLDIITAGPIPPNPSELLGSENMGLLLEQLEKDYDYIFLDTPPVNAVSDALLLTSNAAGVLLVVRQKQTTYEEIQNAIGKIKNVKACVLGVVINGVKEEASLYSYNYKYKYYEQ